MKPTLEDMLQYQEAFVKPMVDAVRAEVSGQLSTISQSHQTLTTLVQAHDSRIKSLESSQKKALIGYTVFTTGLAFGLSAGWAWVKRTLKISVG